MNESESKIPKYAVSSYEKSVGRGYDKFGLQEISIKKWGTAIKTNGERFNAYTDRKFITNSFSTPLENQIKNSSGEKSEFVVADLGGDNGFLLHEVIEDIKNKNPNVNIKGLVVDIDSTGKAQKGFLEKKAKGERDDMEFIVADMTKLPFGDENA